MSLNPAILSRLQPLISRTPFVQPVAHSFLISFLPNMQMLVSKRFGSSLWSEPRAAASESIISNDAKRKDLLIEEERKGDGEPVSCLLNPSSVLVADSQSVQR